MTEFLVQRLIRDAQNTEDPSVREAYGRLAGIVGVVCNVLLSAGKLLAALRQNVGVRALQHDEQRLRGGSVVCGRCVVRIRSLALGRPNTGCCGVVVK